MLLLEDKNKWNMEQVSRIHEKTFSETDERKIREYLHSGKLIVYEDGYAWNIGEELRRLQEEKRRKYVYDDFYKGELE